MGADPSLLYSRSLLLQTLAATTASASAADAVLIVEQKHLDLLIICHTLARKDAQLLCETARSRIPTVKIILIEMMGVQQSEPGEADILFAVEDGPRLLLRAARSRLAEPSVQPIDRNLPPFRGVRPDGGNKAPSLDSHSDHEDLSSDLSSNSGTGSQ